MKNVTFGIIGLLLICSCQPSQPDPRQAEQEIMEAEAAFSQMAEEAGIAEAFLSFAAEDAVLNRNGRIIRGKAAIETYFSEQDHSAYQSVSLSWKPDFVSAASSGDIGYTWGSYDFTTIDTTGAKSVSSGIFHTVWQKQSDGSWKYVYD